MRRRRGMNMVGAHRRLTETLTTLDSFARITQSRSTSPEPGMAGERQRTMALPPSPTIAADKLSLVNLRSRLHHQPTRLVVGNTLVSPSSSVISQSVRYGWLEHVPYPGVTDVWVLLTSGRHQSVCVFVMFFLFFTDLNTNFKNLYLELGVSKWSEPNFVGFIMECSN